MTSPLSSHQPVLTPSDWAPGILADWQIERLCTSGQDMITPFHHSNKANGCISYGLSSYGYDVTLAPEYKLFTDRAETRRKAIILDPKQFDPDCYLESSGPTLIIPPGGFALGRTVEYLKIPRDILVVALAKSTYARLGLVVGVTPLEPAFEGEITLELSNTTPYPVVVYANEGICQFLFYKGSAECEVSYADRGGKYMGQRGVTDARMKHD